LNEQMPGKKKANKTSNAPRAGQAGIEPSQKKRESRLFEREIGQETKPFPLTGRTKRKSHKQSLNKRESFSKRSAEKV